ncbi:peptide deformylase [Candidatus Dojkabacteria bacterium]|uniref:Peptide deformylase n=1 Tax=Candidatus Dojkabacteria bacterium TaxID=2099670 RepID=A0A3M0YXL4_9BACT|nr:MAG: peptide deformylase [Candidatus Dojkabacteria bacterium]
MKIVQYGHPALERVAIPVKLPLPDEDKDLIKGMMRILSKRSKSSAGLAAPQVGVSKRVCIVRRFDLEDNDSIPIWDILINPKILEKSDTLSVEWEGCLSINNGELWGEVARPDFVKVEYYDESGNIHKVEAFGFQAHVYQHEIDHLDGILFLRYISDPSKLYTTEEMLKKISKKNSE